MDYAIETRHLTKAYGSRRVVDDLTFSIPTGHVVGLIGPNGAGKTTTMKMLVGLASPTGGDVDLLGVPVGASGWGETLKRVGTMIEEPPIYQRMTARQNLEYQSLTVTGRVDNEEIDRLLTLVDLFDRADDRPRGYSLGMKQRLGIATSLIGRPDLVILDEPANGLDPAGIREIRRLLRRLSEEGTTVLVSSHQLAEVQQACDRLVILAAGRLVTEGTTGAILAHRTSHHLHVVVPEEQVPAAVAALAAQSIEVSAAGPNLVLTLPDGIEGGDINRILAGVGVFPDEITRPAVSLEDAFLELVNDPGSQDRSASPSQFTTPEGVHR